MTSRGHGVTIAVVDTGICSTLLEFPAAKRFPLDIPSAFSGNHWVDTKGHGSMCATIAGATKSAGGRFDGVSPDAMALSARTTLMASDIHTIYDELISAKKEGKFPGRFFDPVNRRSWRFFHTFSRLGANRREYQSAHRRASSYRLVVKESCIDYRVKSPNAI
jgi:Subtilase family